MTIQRGNNGAKDRNNLNPLGFWRPDWSEIRRSTYDQVGEKPTCLSVCRSDVGEYIGRDMVRQ